MQKWITSFLFLSLSSAFIHASEQPGKLELQHQTSVALWGSFIYWQPEQNFMDIALKSKFALNNDALGISWTDGKIIDMHSSFQPGFILGAGYGFPHSHLELFATYTRLHTHNEASVSRSAEGFLFARWIQPNLLSHNSATHLSTDWWLHMDLINLEVGRHCKFGKHFVLKPHAGVATAWIDQKFTAHMEMDTPPIHLRVKDTSSSWGIGPRMGVEGRFLFPPFTLVGNLATEILFTHYHLKLKEKAINAPSVFLFSSNTFNEIRPEFEMYVGVNYATHLLRPHTYLSAEVGYDFQFWWNQNMIRWYNDSTFIAAPQGNLYFQGLRLTLKLDF